MFISKLKYRALLGKIDDLENRLCPFNNHDYVIRKEYYNSEYCGGRVECWTERELECARCGRQIKDGSELGFRYKARKNDCLE